MRNMLMAGAALMLGIAPLAASAQSPVGGTNSIEDKRGYDALDEAQKAEYDAWPEEYQTVYVAWPAAYQTAYWGWPTDYRTAYWGWPADYQTYYWALTPEQQTAYWVLTDEQRANIYAMTPEQRTAAWAAITAQMAAAQEPEPVVVSDALVQDAPAPKAEYPICKGDIQDSCVQPRAAGENWGPRPLDYWPGKPASEM